METKSNQVLELHSEIVAGPRSFAAGEGNGGRDGRHNAAVQLQNIAAFVGAGVHWARGDQRLRHQTYAAPYGGSAEVVHVIPVQSVKDGQCGKDA